LPSRLPTACICLLLLLVPGSAAAADGESTSALPPQGLYEGCAPGAPGPACAARLAEIRSAGFRVVLNYSAWYGSPAEVLAYADQAAALGLQLIWPLNHPAWRGLVGFPNTYPRLTGDHETLGEADSAARAIALVADHPATWGFYIGDELPPWEAGRVAALGALVRALAPERPLLRSARATRSSAPRRAPPGR